MDTAIAREDVAREVGQARRLSAIVTAVVAAVLGYALAEALMRARTSDAFIVPPTPGQIGGYAMVLTISAALALAFEFGSPPLVARGGHAARNLRALIRRRFRRGRTRADIANVETGLTVSFCIVFFALALEFTTAKIALAVVIPLAIILNLGALSGMSRLVGYDKLWSSLIGLFYGLGASYVLN